MLTEELLDGSLPTSAKDYLGAPPYALEPLQENAACLRNATRRLFLKQILPEDALGDAAARLPAQRVRPAAGQVTWLLDAEVGNALSSIC